MEGQTTDPVLAGILGDLPRGEELREPHVGEHRAILKAVSPVVNGNGGYQLSDKGNYRMEIRFSGVKNADTGNLEDFSDFVNVPTESSDVNVQRMFLQLLHTLNLIPYSDKRKLTVADDGGVDKVAELFRTKIGSEIAIKIEEKDGFTRVRYQRERR
jgi:hypothetical protein